MNKKSVCLCILTVLLFLSFAGCGTKQTEKKTIEYNDSMCNKFFNVKDYSMVTSDDENLYFYDVFDNGIKSYNLTNEKTEEICKANATNLTYFNNRIYYLNGDDDYKIYCMNTDGSNNIAVNDFSVFSFIEYENVLYCNVRKGAAPGIYSISGSHEIKKISSDIAEDIFPYQNKLYYNCNYENSKVLKSINTNGADEVTVFYGNVEMFFIFEDKVYYSETLPCDRIYSMDMNGENSEIVLDDVCIHTRGGLNVWDNTVYYRDMISGKYAKLNLNDGKTEQLNSTDVYRNLYISKGYLIGITSAETKILPLSEWK